MTDRAIEDRVRAWALQQDDVRAGLVVGSRARDDHPADEWSDLDVVLFVRDVGVRHRDPSWLGEIAPVWLWLRGHTAGGEPECLALFDGGEQVDLVFHPVTDLGGLSRVVEVDDVPATIRRGARILFDKDGLVPPLPPPGRPPVAAPPSETELREALEAFWFGAVYCAKQLRRGELWSFQNGSSLMLSRLLQIVEWERRAMGGAGHDTWHAGKFIAEWADPTVYGALHQVYSHLDEADGWRAVQARLDLVHELGGRVATSLGHEFPAELERRILDCIDTIRRSGPPAETGSVA